jgi:uncharacterized membrane protein
MIPEKIYILFDLDKKRSLPLLLTPAVDVHVVQLVYHPWRGLHQHTQRLGLAPR